MTRSNPPNFSRHILLLTASIFLLAAPQGALAKHKDHSDDHSGMSSNDSNDDHGDEHSEDHKDKNKDHAEKDMKSDKHKGKHKEESAENGMDSEKHKGKHKDEKSAEKTKDTEQDKTTGNASTASGNTPTADGGGLLIDRGIVGKKPADIKPVDQGTASGPGSANKIHSISSPPPRVVTISVGGGSFQMYDGPGGVTVTSHHPGTLTISNGVQTQTLSGIKVTISGSVGVGVAKGLGVGRPDTPGSTVVLSPNGTVTGGGLPGDFQAYDPPLQ